MAEERAYALTRALWHPDNRPALSASHPQGRNITLNSAIVDHDVPLHPGAARYYRQAGRLAEEDGDNGIASGEPPVLMHRRETEPGAGSVESADGANPDSDLLIDPELIRNKDGDTSRSPRAETNP